MKKLLYVVGFMFLSAYSFSRGYQENISLPEGTNIETAKDIVMHVWNDNFMQKVSTQFPNFDPVEYPNKYGMSLRWVIFESFKGEKKIFIQLNIKSREQLENKKEILSYGKKIVEQGVNDYFHNQP